MVKHNTPRQPEQIQKQIDTLRRKLSVVSSKNIYGVSGLIAKLEIELAKSKQFQFEAK